MKGVRGVVDGLIDVLVVQHRLRRGVARGGGRGRVLGLNQLVRGRSLTLLMRFVVIEKDKLAVEQNDKGAK